MCVGPPAIGASAAEELTKRLPDGVIGFVATSGGDALKGDFEKTALGRIWNDPGVRKFYQAIKTELMAKAAEESDDPNVSKQVDLVHQLRPAGDQPADPPRRLPSPGQGRAAHRRASRSSMRATARRNSPRIVSKLEAMIGQEVVDAEVGSLKVRQFKENDEFPLYWGWVGSHFVIAVNDAQGAAAKYVSQPRAAAPAYSGQVARRRRRHDCCTATVRRSAS